VTAPVGKFVKSTNKEALPKPWETSKSIGKGAGVTSIRPAWVKGADCWPTRWRRHPRPLEKVVVTFTLSRGADSPQPVSELEALHVVFAGPTSNANLLLATVVPSDLLALAVSSRPEQTSLNLADASGFAGQAEYLRIRFLHGNPDPPLAGLAGLAGLAARMRG
jgi:hypothetical protein